MKTLTVYSKDNCPYCIRAKQYLDRLGIEYEEINVSTDPTMREWLKARGHRTVPQIYLGDELFVEGGCDGLTKLTKAEIITKLVNMN